MSIAFWSFDERRFCRTVPVAIRSSNVTSAITFLPCATIAAYMSACDEAKLLTITVCCE